MLFLILMANYIIKNLITFCGDYFEGEELADSVTNECYENKADSYDGYTGR